MKWMIDAGTGWMGIGMGCGEVRPASVTMCGGGMGRSSMSLRPRHAHGALFSRTLRLPWLF